METQPYFKEGDRFFTHYDMQWGTVESVDRTYRDKVHGVTGNPLPDTTWYNVRYDNGASSMLDDAHGNWDMARMVPPHIAKRYGYGDDPCPFHVVKHVAHMTGACWFKVVDGNGADIEDRPLFFDYEDAQEAADLLNARNPSDNTAA